MSGVAYLDASALVKLVIAEPESEALIAFLREADAPITSEIARVEVARAARRASDALEIHERAERVMSAVALLRTHDGVLESACWIDPPTLRTLDALHLAAARSLGEDLSVFVAYDTRLVEAARAAGLNVASPGAD